MLFDELMKLHVIPNAEKNWAEYRNILTNFILNNSVNCEKILIVGAGACNDIDIMRIADKISKVVLTDRDLRIVRQACEDKFPKAEIEIVYSDYVGITDEDYSILVELLRGYLRSGGSINEFDSVFLENAERLLTNAVPSVEITEKYDIVVAAAVHSQLIGNLGLIWDVFSTRIGIDGSDVFNRLKIYNDGIIKEFNNILLKYLKNNGMLITALETEREGKGAVEGAYQALFNLESLCDKGIINLIDSKSVRWPFTDNCNYKMRLDAFKRIM